MVVLMCMNMVFVGMFMVMLVMVMLLMIMMVMLMHVLVFFNAQCDYPRMCTRDATFHAALEVISHIRDPQ